MWGVGATLGPYMMGYALSNKSQAIIGVQMASAYVGSCLMPPLFGIIANHITVALLPVYLLIVLILMVVMHEMLTRKSPIKNTEK